MMEPQFYALIHPDPGQSLFDTEFDEEEPINRTGALKCPSCHGAVTSRIWVSPFIAKLTTWGRAFGDFAFLSDEDVLVSSRVRTAFEESDLVGITEFCPIEIKRIVRRKRFQGPPPAYHYLRIAQSGANIDDAASETYRKGIKKPMCPQCHEAGIDRFKRVILQPNTWTGEDIFAVWGLPSAIMVTERFKIFCEQNAFTNAIFVPAEEYSYDAWDFSDLRM